MDGFSGITDAVHGALMQQHQIDMISNNLANVNTPGFKEDRLLFDDLMTREFNTFFQQGSLRQTDNALDLAIEGDGFFKVMTDRGIRLTRNGAFKMTSEGIITTSNGDQVLDDGGSPITINPEGPAPSINSKGYITQGREQVGQVALVEVADLKGLMKEGANYWVGIDGNTPPSTAATNTTIAQGSLEMSNVDTVYSMVNMISSFRAFESYQKAIHAFHDMDTKAATQVGRVA